ncbi:hypothetical protein D9M69_646550 [compost metagenome]
MVEVVILLLVEVAELCVPGTDLGAFVVERVFTAAEVETVRREGRGFAVHEHVIHARIVARTVLAELAAVDRQAADLGRRQLATLEGLWQRAAIV